MMSLPMVAHVDAIGHLGPTAFGVAAAGVYLVAWSGSPRPQPRHAVAFLAGLAMAVAVDTPPAEAWASATFTRHMIQHLVLYLVVPLLIVLGRPADHLRHLGPTWRRALRPAGPGRATSAVVTVVVGIAVLYTLHLTSIYDLALDHPLLHLATHVALVGAGVLLWELALRPGIHDGPARAGIALFAGVPIVVLGIVLTTGTTALSAHYREQLGAAEALADQRQGGALMWIGAMLGGAIITLVTVWRWAAHEERARLRLELAERSGSIHH